MGEYILMVGIGIIWSLVGLCFGSFSNVLIYRLSNNVPLTFKSRSFCPHCSHQLAWYDNIPLFSYIFLKGKCRYCHEKISLQYPLVELAGLIIFLSCYMFFNFQCFTSNFGTFIYTSKAFTYSFIMLLLLVMAFIDYKTTMVPLSLQFCLGFVVIFEYVYECIVSKDYLFYNLLGLGVSLGFFLLVYFGFYLLKKKEGLGLGDVIIFSLMGLLLGIFQFVLIVLISSISCSIIELLKLKRTKESKMIPFVPYIAASSIFTMFFGNIIINSYLNLLGVTL